MCHILQLESLFIKVYIANSELLSIQSTLIFTRLGTRDFINILREYDTVVLNKKLEQITGYSRSDSKKNAFNYHSGFTTLLNPTLEKEFYYDIAQISCPTVDINTYAGTVRRLSKKLKCSCQLSTKNPNQQRQKAGYITRLR